MLQWFSANIGFHHIHHLSPRIPNYNLQKCHESERLFQQVKPITLWVQPEMPDVSLVGRAKQEAGRLRARTDPPALQCTVVHRSGPEFAAYGQIPRMAMPTGTHRNAPPDLWPSWPPASRDSTS